MFFLGFFFAVMFNVTLNSTIQTNDLQHRCPARYSSRKAYDFILPDIRGSLHHLSVYEERQVILHFFDENHQDNVH